jgi:hypothetical protein
MTGDWAIRDDVGWRVWDPDIIAYADGSDETFHLADISGWVFAYLTRRPASEGEIVAAARATLALASSESVETVVRKTLAHLAERQLVAQL